MNTNTAVAYPAGPAPFTTPLTQLRFGIALRRDPLGKFTELFQAYGDTFHLQFGETHVFTLSHPDHFHEVLVEKAASFYKAADYKDEKRGLARFLGSGLVTSDGDYWKRQRRLAQPAFHARRIEAYAQTMVDFTQDMLNTWQYNHTVDVAEEMTALTLRIIAKTQFNTAMTADIRQIAEAVTTFQQFVTGIDIFPLWVPTPAHLKQKQHKQRMDEIIYRLIRERRAPGNDEGDLLSMFLETFDDDGGGMTDRQIRDEMATVFLAGHETTANALNWIWYLLSQHPQVQARLHNEIDSVLQGKPPTMADLKRLPYVEMVIKEAMRLYPPVWQMSRQAIADVEIGGFRVPRGSHVTLVQYFTHRDPRWWDYPEQFIPERFTPEQEKQRYRYAYLPFSNGPRVCIGNHFAMLEASLIVASIAQHFELALQPEHQVMPEALIALRPKGGLPMILQHRQPGERRSGISLEAPESMTLPA
jgi:cytochrome P450